jgi:hypothetical protein
VRAAPGWQAEACPTHVRLACVAELLEGGAGRRQGFGGALQMRYGFGARVWIDSQDGSQNQVRLWGAGIQAEGGVRGGDGFREAIEPVLRVGEIGELHRAGSGDGEGARELGGGLLKALSACTEQNCYCIRNRQGKSIVFMVGIEIDEGDGGVAWRLSKR